ncbi:glutathione S-transferase family protein [Qipengyuania atrilutea]|uniref:Glutathione S-transferase family protein n=1 Tax=Qipengyuania atrilutea TaxID=2744473 RepID=A0A850H586_9SPHN|nr:glutathione S-transferase N-terminal domain-containing protein [Actirhodobacter atriluteus]NVD44285.1 glutathione S-transferase family protein [Actirhodobacter atriluteus]
MTRGVTDPIILYGLPHSLYSGRARIYLRKQGIAYREVAPSDPRFASVIVPQIGRAIIPVIELPDGTVVQDTVDIIDHFEAQGQRYPAYPSSAVLRTLLHLFELYAVFGLTRHAMHYRWSYLGEQERFLRDQFGVGGDSQRTEATMARMNSYLPMLGVTEATIPAIEDSYHRLLQNLENHFTRFPYLLGFQPSIGDYAMFGPLFAHLGRDPVPLGIMQREAPKVFRWTERMHAPNLDMLEYGKDEAAYASIDELQDTLGPLLRQIADEIVPGLMDRLAALEEHVSRGAAVPGEPVTDKPHRRIIGTVATRFMDAEYEGGVQPYTFLLWQRLLDAAGGDEDTRALFASCGLKKLVDTRLPVRVERKDHIEVWGKLAD